MPIGEYVWERMLLLGVNLEIPFNQKANGWFVEVRMEIEDLRKLIIESVLPYGIDQETGYGWSFSVDTKKEVRYKSKECVFDEYLSRLANCKAGIVQLNIIDLIDRPNSLAEDSEDTPVAIRFKGVCVFQR